MLKQLTCCLPLVCVAALPALAAENFEQWPVLKSTFPSTGGGGITIKGYDPVITGGKCITTFMAVEAGENPKVYTSVIEFDAVPTAGGTLCTAGKWRAFDGGASGTTPFRVFFKDGIFRGQ
ncbi:MAG: hypothetical protein ABL898_18345 [Hyphomicrobiaceae bacterium]